MSSAHRRRSVNNWKWRRIGLAVLAIWLGGCGGLANTKPCPPVAAFPAGLADEVEKLPATSPLFVALADYFVLHEQCR